MYSIDLKQALCEELTAHLSKLATTKPNVYIDEIPKSKFENQKIDVFPFVLIEVSKGVIPVRSKSDISNTRTVIINLGVDTSKPNHADIETITGSIIEYILNKRYIGDLFELTGNEIIFEYGKLDEQGLSPFKYGYIQLEFKMPSIADNTAAENILT